jgi:glycosyltransferase involved in cell wall biosynthesis
MSRFPHLPETFNLREMIELEKLGWHIALYPWVFRGEAVVHREAQDWVKRAHRLPYLSSQVMYSNLSVFSQRPLQFSKILAQALVGNLPSRKFLSRAAILFPKSVHMARIMQREGVAHVHAHYATHPALVAWVIHQLTGISYSLTVHAHDIFVDTTMLATKLRSASFIVAISKYNRDYLRRVVGEWVGEKTYIVHCGILPEMYSPTSRDAYPPDVFEIISVGSLQPYKGFPYLIEACAILRDRQVPFHCKIIGAGEEESRLRQLIHLKGLNRMVELLGAKPQNEVAKILGEAHCYVQPSLITSSGKMEGVPVALMEAMASGLPVVATEISGIPELVRAGESGLLVPAKDALALAEALMWVYRSPEAARLMAEKGRMWVLQEFDLRQSVLRLSSLFERYLTRSVSLSN